MSVVLNNSKTHLISLPLELGQIVPGNNVLSDDVWAKAKEFKLIKIFLEQGDLTVKEQVQGEFPLRELSQSKAIRLVSDTFNTRLLSSWYKLETRKNILDSIERQLELIDLQTKVEEKTV